MGYLGRRIGKSQDTGNPTADGTGAGILDLFTNGYFQRQGNVFNAPGLPPAPISATGGAISYSGGKTIHTFTALGTFQVNSGSGSVEYLVVAGGGGGGTQHGGGGGGGGFRTSAGFFVSPGPYGITVGGGGAGSPTGPSFSRPNGTNGGDSTFGSIVATGGGGGSLSQVRRMLDLLVDLVVDVLLLVLELLPLEVEDQVLHLQMEFLQQHKEIVAVHILDIMLLLTMVAVVAVVVHLLRENRHLNQQEHLGEQVMVEMEQHLPSLVHQ